MAAVGWRVKGRSSNKSADVTLSPYSAHFLGMALALARSSIDAGIVLRARRSLSDSNGDSEERENLQTASS